MVKVGETGMSPSGINKCMHCQAVCSKSQSNCKTCTGKVGSTCFFSLHINVLMQPRAVKHGAIYMQHIE